MTKGLELSGGDAEMIKVMMSINEVIGSRDAENKMRDFGNLVGSRESYSGANYKSISNLDSLKTVTADPGSRFYYPALRDRFLADDPGLTPTEIYMLIVGYPGQAAYGPFNYNDIFEVKALAGHNIDTAISHGITLSKNNPLSPSLNRELMYFYRKKGDAVAAARYQNRIQQFFSGVLYSGNGSCERPYIALWAKEEYNFITYLGYISSDSHSMGSCAGQMAEIIEMSKPGDKETEKIHFNVRLIYLQTVGK